MSHKARQLLTLVKRRILWIHDPHNSNYTSSFSSTKYNKARFASGSSSSTRPSTDLSSPVFPSTLNHSPITKGCGLKIHNDDSRKCKIMNVASICSLVCTTTVHVRYVQYSSLENGLNTQGLTSYPIIMASNCNMHICKVEDPALPSMKKRYKTYLKLAP